MDYTHEQRVPLLRSFTHKQQILIMVIAISAVLLLLLLLFMAFFGPKDKKPAYLAAVSTQYQLIELSDVIAEYELTPDLNNLNATLRATTASSYTALEEKAVGLFAEFDPQKQFDPEPVEKTLDEAAINGTIVTIASETLTTALTNTKNILQTLLNETSDEDVRALVGADIEYIDTYLEQLEQQATN